MKKQVDYYINKNDTNIQIQYGRTMKKQVDYYINEKEIP